MDIKYGKLALAAGYKLQLRVLLSAAGYYIGTSNTYGPISRESVEYYVKLEAAQYALDNEIFTQRSGY